MQKFILFTLICFIFCNTKCTEEKLFHKNGNEIEHSKYEQNYTAYDQDVCTLELKNKSINNFRHIVYYGDLGLAFLRLNLTNGLSLGGSKDVVGENMWIWTYFGKKGGMEFLTWPIEYGIWSIGILNTFVGGPLNMELFNTSGDCTNLTVGDPNTDVSVTLALTKLSDAMTNLDGTDQRYGPSFWCYKRRTYINPNAIYYLCKHIMCPVEAMEYVCRSYFYNPEKQRRELSFYEYVFKYDTLWWIIPFIVAIVLFSFSPLLLMCVGAETDKYLNKWKSQQDYDSDEYIFLDGSNHITLVKTIIGPLYINCRRKSLLLSRLFRSILPVLSLSIVALQILLDYRYLYDVVVLSTNKAVPMGFRSMLAGYTSSSLNFLPWLGGPFIACSVYLLVTSVLVCIPNSLSKHLATGLSNKDISEGLSPLSLSISVIERYGSVLISPKYGYERIYSVLLAQFYLLINTDFWKLLTRLQQTRWKKFKTSKARAVLLPAYLIVCFCEILLCILKYGFPIISYAIIIYRAYSSLLYRSIAKRVCKLILVFAVAVLVMSIVFFLFMFCTIFLDACLFICRLCIFTYTGIVVYPRVSYGYMIFIATVIYYLWECIQNFSSYYNNLLHVIVSVCESIQRANDIEPLVVRQSHCKGIKVTLYYDVIELYSPRRKKVLTSVLQISVIFCILGMSVHLLMQTDKFQELHTIMHVGTTLFICAFPKIVKSICCSQESKVEQRKRRAEIKIIVRRCLDFFSDDESEEVNLLRTN